MPHLHYSIKDAVAEFVIENPPQNRIGDQFCEDLVAAIDRAHADGARAILVRSTGDNFSYGGDIRPWPDMDVTELRGRFEAYMSAFNRLERVSMPVVSAVRGMCSGGGFELALRTDIIFAGESARFAHSEQTIGIVTLLGGVYRVAARVGRARALEWVMTSEQVSAQRMAEAGLVNYVTPDEEVEERAREFAARLAAGPTRAHAAHKALVRTWEATGALGADDAMFDIAMPLFETEDVRTVLPAAVDAYVSGAPRPAFEFRGR
ncbi:enoyl-CoA hydratase/isomerase family protein [Nocardioides sp. WG-D5]